MKSTTRMRTLPAALLAAALGAAAAEPPGPIARKGQEIFGDGFAAGKLGPAWRSAIPAFTVAGGMLKGSQERADHGAVIRAAAPFKDAVIEFSFRLEGSTGFNAVADDKDYKGSHAGHICRVAVSQKQIRLADDKEGAMRNDIFALRSDALRRAEADKLLEGKSAAVPVALERGRWYRMAIEIVGDQMRVSLDGKAAAFLKSPGIAHPTKAEFGFTVSGKEAHFDDLHIWAAEPAGL